MTATLDKAGRVVLPKRVREKLHLKTGTVFKLEVVGDKIELECEAPKTQVAWKDGLPVVMGWEGFEAAKAINEMREEYDARLSSPFRKA